LHGTLNNHFSSQSQDLSPPDKPLPHLDRQTKTAGDSPKKRQKFRRLPLDFSVPVWSAYNALFIGLAPALL
jgi:hypothetical protein